MSFASGSYSPPRAPHKIGALVAVALHALACIALMSHEPARSALFAAAPIMVDLITTSKPEPRQEKPLEIPPSPKPVAKPKATALAPLPVIAAPAEAPSPVVVSPPQMQPSPPAEPHPRVVAATQPVPVSPPVFNADYLHNPPPAYPPLSRRLGEEGRVILRVLVNAAGRADEVQVGTSSGHARLDDAARETVRAWRFIPAKRGEEPVTAWVLIPISFRLEG